MTSRKPETGEAAGDPDHGFDSAPSTRGLGRRAVRAAAITMTSNSLRVVLETIRIVVLARLLMPADYGLVAMVTAVTGLIEMFKDLGLNTATVTRQRLSHAQVSTLFWVNVGAGAALSAIAAASAPLIAWFYGEARLTSIALALAPTFVLAGLTVQHQALLRRDMRFGALAGIRILEVSVGVCVGVLVAWRGGAYWALVAMPIASAVTNMAAVWIASRWRPGPPVRGVGTRDMVRFGSQVMGTGLVTYLSRRIGHLLLGWWSGAVQLGLYTKSTSLVETPISRVLAPIESVFVPSLSRLVGEPARYRDGYLRVLRMLCLVSMPGAAFMVGCADWLIPFLLGSHWLEAVPIFAVLAALDFLRPIEASNWWLLVTQDRASDALRWSAVAALFSTAAVAAGLAWGAIGVSIALVVVGFLRLPLLVWYTTRKGPVSARDLYRTLAAPGLASALALLALFVVTPRLEVLGSALVIGLGFCITGLVFVTILALLPSGREGLRDAWSGLRSLAQRGA